MNNEYIEIFIEDTEEYITALSDTLFALEKDFSNNNLINNIFRIAHTMKSSAAALGFEDISNLSHKAEDMMSEIRDGKKNINTTIIDLLFEYLDAIKVFIEELKQGNQPNLDISDLTNRIENAFEKVQEVDKNNEDRKEDTLSDLQKQNFMEQLTNSEKILIKKALKNFENCFYIYIEFEQDAEFKHIRAELILNNSKKIGSVIKIFPHSDFITSNKFLGAFAFILITAIDKENVRKRIEVDLLKKFDIREIKNKIEKKLKGTNTKKNIKKQNSTVSNKKTNVDIISTNSTIRVHTKKLDDLMNLVGELVISSSGLRMIENRMLNTNEKVINLHRDLRTLNDKIHHITSDLQDSIMRARMLPVSNLFNQFRQIIRDLSKVENKNIELEMYGQDTELDKSVIDALGGPLKHIVRNSIDHGIESPFERKKIGKPEKAIILLSALQIGNQIQISVKDDGKGIDLEKIKATAIKKNLINADEVERISYQKIIDFIFEPGFSTAEKVTSISGRGVGLDAVKDTINKLNGSIDVKTEKEKGTEFRILLPLTLAISSVILFRLANEMYALPILDINEIIDIPINETRDLNGERIFNLRGHVLPLIDINELFNVNEKTNINKYSKDTILTIIIVLHRGQKIGLIVDKVIGRQNIVLKPIDKQYNVTKSLSGAAILGDGSIVLVIDIPGIVKLAKLHNKIKDLSMDNLKKDEME